MATPDEDLPPLTRKRRSLPDVGYETRLEHLKALRDRRAEACALDPGLVCPNGTLQAIARAAPSSPTELRNITELRTWQRDVLGEPAILEASRTG
jgi:ribonuclease D